MMQVTHFTRRKIASLVIGVAGMSAVSRLVGSAGASTLPLIKVGRDPSCGCCALWADHLREAGFPVEINDRRDLAALKVKLGVPSDLVSCHTGEVAGYVIEGHVPASAIVRLLESKESIRGLSVPRMPIGSPGMESGDPGNWPIYDVIAFGPQGRRVFARYKGSQAV